VTLLPDGISGLIKCCGVGVATFSALHICSNERGEGFSVFLASYSELTKTFFDLPIVLRSREIRLVMKQNVFPVLQFYGVSAQTVIVETQYIAPLQFLQNHSLAYGLWRTLPQ
jgi:hypothetical protein